MNNQKETMFFILLTLVMFAIGFFMYKIQNKLESKQHLLAVFTIVVLLYVIMLYYIYQNMCKQKDSFNFEVSKPKKCEGYPYLLSSSSKELQNYCKELMSTSKGRDQFVSMNCGKKYVGRPLHFERDPMSDDNWENNMGKPNYDYPQVL